MPALRSFMCCLFFGLLSCEAHAQDETASQLLESVRASLVEVRSVDSKTFNEGNGHVKVATFHAQGSGIIIDSHGTIVTNTHIIAGAGHIYAGLYDGTVLEAKLVYSSDADFSFIKIDPPYPLSPITWADSSLAPVGTPIIALTNGEGQDQHILGGEITGLTDGITSNQVELLELNLDLVPGDSGGPLLDTQGHLLGLIMAKRKDEENKSYAIASNKIQQEYSRYQENLE